GDSRHSRIGGRRGDRPRSPQSDQDPELELLDFGRDDSCADGEGQLPRSRPELATERNQRRDCPLQLAGALAAPLVSYPNELSSAVPAKPGTLGLSRRRG